MMHGFSLFVKAAAVEREQPHNFDGAILGLDDFDRIVADFRLVPASGMSCRCSIIKPLRVLSSTPSPKARTESLDGTLSAAWRSQEDAWAQVLDAMVRKLRALDAVRPIDFTLVSGDLIDNNQTNELDWFLKVLAGQALQPNSGVLERIQFPARTTIRTTR